MVGLLSYSMRAATLPNADNSHDINLLDDNSHEWEIIKSLG